MAHDVFICYSSKDRAVAAAACAKLEAKGIRCWIAPRDPIAGIPYGRQLVGAIDESKTVLLIFSENSNRSDHVLRELELAADRSKTIIPLRTDGVLPTGDLEYYIRRVHWLDAMTPPLESRLDELAILVRRILDMGVPEPERLPGVETVAVTPTVAPASTVAVTQPALQVASATARAATRNRALPFVLIAIIVALAAGVGIFFATGAGKSPEQVAVLATAGGGAATAAPAPSDDVASAMPSTDVATPGATDAPSAAAGPVAPSAAVTRACETDVDDPNPPLNVRDAPTSSGNVVATIPDSTKLTVDERRDGWSHITAPSSGWVFSALTTTHCE